ncbi:MAG TPA: glutathione S-transferase family protein [Gaiellaceae bacterium]|nr:glutathione S-transferase family protein [Gaiellaceae bacterium]
MKLYDAARCPYCARVRIAFAEKGLEFDRVEVDLSNRPPWLIELNPPAGRVPVLDDGFVLPESEVIMEYLEERYPTPALMPESFADRADARCVVYRFDDLLGHDYYAFRRGEENELDARLEALPVGRSLFSDIAYVPWVLRAREMLGLTLPAQLEAWLQTMLTRPSVAAELEIVRAQ